jgi:AcrR family transcriptional regulator
MTQQKIRLSRAMVIDMAAVIADSEGIDAVTLSRIALDAGVKQPALYRHVTGIEELWTLLSLRARDLLVTDLTTAITNTTRDTAVLQLHMPGEALCNNTQVCTALQTVFPLLAT